MSALGAVGILPLGRIRPGAGRDSKLIPPGRWALHTSSTVPYVLISAGPQSRVLTWGEANTLDRGGQLTNVSAHEGDVVLAPVADGVAPLRPSSYSLPAVFYDGQVATSFLYKRIDTRGVIRAQLIFIPVPAGPTVPFNAKIRQYPTDRSLWVNPGGAGDGAGFLEYTNVFGVGDTALNLAPGSTNAPNDGRPGVFLDQLEVQVDEGAAPVSGKLNAFFVLQLQ